MLAGARHAAEHCWLAIIRRDRRRLAGRPRVVMQRGHDVVRIGRITWVAGRRERETGAIRGDVVEIIRGRR